MADLVIHGEDLARRLLEKAEQKGQTVEDMLVGLLMKDEIVDASEPVPGSFAALAKAAEEAGIGRDSEPTDTSEHSREILNTEFGDYLKRRMNE